jgi:hypothetical protein
MTASIGRQVSWDSVFRYPILGSVIFTGSIICGGHSTIVDVLAYGGVPYASLYYWLIIITPINKVKLLSKGKNLKNLLIAVFFTVSLLTGIFDTISYAYAWVWFLLMPYVALASEINKEV